MKICLLVFAGSSFIQILEGRMLTRHKNKEKKWRVHYQLSYQVNIPQKDRNKDPHRSDIPYTCNIMIEVSCMFSNFLWKLSFRPESFGSIRSRTETSFWGFHQLRQRHQLQAARVWLRPDIPVWFVSEHQRQRSDWLVRPSSHHGSGSCSLPGQVHGGGLQESQGAAGEGEGGGERSLVMWGQE